MWTGLGASSLFQQKRHPRGVATEYGKDSPEYEAAGGVRQSERKKPARKAKTA